MVRKGHYHYAVMSLLAAEHFRSQHPEMVIVARLPVGSYMTVGKALFVLLSCFVYQGVSPLHTRGSSHEPSCKRGLEMLTQHLFETKIYFVSYK